MYSKYILLTRIQDGVRRRFRVESIHTYARGMYADAECTFVQAGPNGFEYKVSETPLEIDRLLIAANTRRNGGDDNETIDT